MTNHQTSSKTIDIIELPMVLPPNADLTLARAVGAVPAGRSVLGQVPGIWSLV